MVVLSLKTIHAKDDQKPQPHQKSLSKLIIQQKLDQKQISQHNLEHFKQNKTDFLRRFKTMDGTWIYYHDPKLKLQRLPWTEAGCSAPTQAKSQRNKEGYGYGFL